MANLLIGSTLSALSTGLGALLILFFHKMLTNKWKDMLLAFTAGIMIAASMFSLIQESVKIGGMLPLAVGLFLGVAAITIMEVNLPQMDFAAPKKSGLDPQALLIVAAITLHNLPEGLSVGVSYAFDAEKTGNMIAFAIGLQNAPEGFLVALFLINQKINQWKAFIIATLTGAIEIVSGIGGYYLTSLVDGLVPYGLAFAAVAMLYIIYKELIPESHSERNKRAVSYAFIIGILFMVLLIEKL